MQFFLFAIELTYFYLLLNAFFSRNKLYFCIQNGKKMRNGEKESSSPYKFL